MPEIPFDNIESIVGSEENVELFLRALPIDTFYWKNPEGNDTGYATHAQVVDATIVIYNLKAAGHQRKVSLGVKIPEGSGKIDANLERVKFAYQARNYEVRHTGVDDRDPVFGVQDPFER
ncbi:MAG: hypothetical protein AABX04_03600 [Nanoarchaeota archaeon]|mgnify:CR=1 FL=1